MLRAVFTTTAALVITSAAPGMIDCVAGFSRVEVNTDFGWDLTVIEDGWSVIDVTVSGTGQALASDGWTRVTHNGDQSICALDTDASGGGIDLDHGMCSPACQTVVPPSAFSFFADALLQTPMNLYSYATATVPDRLHASVSMGHEALYYEEEAAQLDDGECWAWHRINYSGIANSWVVIPRSYRLARAATPAGLNYSRDHNYSMRVMFESTGFPCSGPSGTSAPVTVIFVSGDLSASDGSQSTSQGVLAVEADGTIHKLGLFSTSIPQVTPQPDGFLVEGNVNVLQQIGDANGAATLDVEEIITADVFSGFDGDLDRNGTACWDDKADIISRLGSHIGDLAYTARGDFDLDGDIDDDDYNLFLAADYFADMDCNRVVDVFDLTAYLDLWFPQDPAADLNRDGIVDVFDLLAYQDAWFALS